MLSRAYSVCALCSVHLNYYIIDSSNVTFVKRFLIQLSKEHAHILTIIIY